MTAVGRFLKGKILARADLGLESPMQEGRDAIAGMQDFGMFGTEHNVLQSDDEETHVNADWFGDQWWTHIDPEHRKRVCQAAYLKAIDVATEERADDDSGIHPKPIVSYWIADGENFEAAVAWTPNQVIVFLLTPPIPEGTPPAASASYPDDCWLISSDELIDEYRSHFPGEYPALEDKELDLLPNHPNIVCQRIVAY